MKIILELIIFIVVLNIFFKIFAELLGGMIKTGIWDQLITYGSFLSTSNKVKVEIKKPGFSIL